MHVSVAYIFHSVIIIISDFGIQSQKEKSVKNVLYTLQEYWEGIKWSLYIQGDRIS